MRILHVAPSFYPAWAYGGVPRCAYELCRELVHLGHDVSAWTTDVFDRDSRLASTSSVVDGIHVRRFPNVSNRLAHDFQVYLPRGAHLATGGIGEFDLVHIHSHRHLLEFVVARAARKVGVPYVLTGNGTVPAIERYVGIKRLLDSLGLSAIVRESAACIAVSRAEVPHYEQVGVARERISIIPNGIRLAEFDRLPEPGRFRQAHGIGEAPLIAFVGKITPRKGVDVLIRSLSMIPEPTQLVVAGNFMMPERPLHELVAALGLEERVHFPGLLLGDDRNALYVDADVVAYPSIDEIFGLVAAEAMMCGSPVVVCGDSGCGELVAAADGGAVVPYGDAAALASSLRSLLDDPQARKVIVERAARYVRENLGWHSIAQRTCELYDEVVGSPVSSSGDV